MKNKKTSILIIFLILISILGFTFKNSITKDEPLLPIEKSYIENIIKENAYPWGIAEDFTKDNNNAFFLEYLGDKKGKLYLNAVSDDRGRFVGLNRMEDEYLYLSDDKNIENKEFLFDFAFEIFGKKDYSDKTYFKFNKFIENLSKENITEQNSKKIFWNTRIDDLVIRVIAKDTGYDGYRVNSVWVFNLDTYEQKNRGDAEAKNDYLKKIDKENFYKPIAITDVLNKNLQNNLCIVKAHITGTRKLNPSEIKKLNEINPQKYSFSYIYEVATLEYDKNKFDAIIINMPLTHKEESKNREYYLTYYKEQDLYIVDYSLKLVD